MTTKHESPHIHHFQVRVYYQDTDAGGVVYHANYIKFAERARTEWLREGGADYNQIYADHRILLVMRKVEIDYLVPSRLDDLIEIETNLIELGGSSMKVKQVFACKGKILAEMKAVIVAVADSGRPVRIPPQLRQILER